MAYVSSQAIDVSCKSCNCVQSSFAEERKKHDKFSTFEYLDAVTEHEL